MTVDSSTLKRIKYYLSVADIDDNDWPKFARSFGYKVVTNKDGSTLLYSDIHTIIVKDKPGIYELFFIRVGSPTPVSKPQTFHSTFALVQYLHDIKMKPEPVTARSVECVDIHGNQVSVYKNPSYTTLVQLSLKYGKLRGVVVNNTGYFASALQSTHDDFIKAFASDYDDYIPCLLIHNKAVPYLFLPDDQDLANPYVLRLLKAGLHLYVENKGLIGYNEYVGTVAPAYSN